MIPVCSRLSAEGKAGRGRAATDSDEEADDEPEATVKLKSSLESGRASKIK